MFSRHVFSLAKAVDARTLEAHNQTRLWACTGELKLLQDSLLVHKRSPLETWKSFSPLNLELESFVQTRFSFLCVLLKSFSLRRQTSRRTVLVSLAVNHEKIILKSYSFSIVCHFRTFFCHFRKSSKNRMFLYSSWTIVVLSAGICTKTVTGLWSLDCVVNTSPLPVSLRGRARVGVGVKEFPLKSSVP